MIGIIVANVPEGLLPQLTVALTITATRMRDKQVIVANLDIIESLGAVTVICSDKTGTLTCNRMTVAHIAYDKTIFTTPITVNLETDQFPEYDLQSESFQTLLLNATLNTDAKFLSHEEDILKREVKGDASEGALIKFAEPINDIEKVRAEYKRAFAIPFNSSNKWMLTILHKNEGDKHLTMMLKGAPEKVLDKCTTYLYKGEILPIDDKARKELEGINTILAKRGERVLGFAQTLMEAKYNASYQFEEENEGEYNFPHNSFTFIGFYALIDPPRPTVKQAIHECNTAGIKVFMVTGDHPTTAHAIAKSLNLITGKTAEELLSEGKEIPPEGCKSIVVKGTELEKFNEDDWTRVLKHEEIVFARTMPQQKQDIVNQLIKLDHIIAMTGDGVNDAPALKAAHVGIAMGSGAAVAKEAGQIILQNDDFSSIVEGVREGRLIFENLKKCICYVISSNIPELIPFLLFIALKIPLSIETIMIILIDVGTDIMPAIALAYEEPEEMIMNIPPRKRDAHLVSLKLMIWSYGVYGVIQTFFAYWAWMWTFQDHGFQLNDLIGAGPQYRDLWNSTAFQNNTERVNFFTYMCGNNTYYQDNYVKTLGKNCKQDFKDYLIKILAIAQSAFLITIVWCQLACLFIRKTQVASIFNWFRIKSNLTIFYAILVEIALICLFIYTPGFNNALLLEQVPPKLASTALWGIPFFLLFDELRKLLCRIKTDDGSENCMVKCSTF